MWDCSVGLLGVAFRASALTVCHLDGLSEIASIRPQGDAQAGQLDQDREEEVANRTHL